MKLLIRNRPRAVAAILVLFLLAACNDADLKTVAKALRDTQEGVLVFQTTVIEAQKQTFISVEATRQLLAASSKVTEAGDRASLITRNINALAPEDRTMLLSVLQPVIAALADTQTFITLNITDLKTQQAIRAALLVVQTSLNIAQASLAGR